MPPFILFLLLVLGIVLLSLAVERLKVPDVAKRFFQTLAACAVGLFILYLALLFLDWIGIADLNVQAAQSPPQDQAVTTAPEHGDIAEKTVSQLPIAYGLVKFMEFLKRVKWFPLSEHSSARALAAMNGVVAFLATMGVTGTFQYADTGTLTVVITGLADVGSKMFSFATQWAFQQYFYEHAQAHKVTVVTHNVVMGTGPGQIAHESTNPTGASLGTGDGTVKP